MSKEQRTKINVASPVWGNLFTTFSSPMGSKECPYFPSTSKAPINSFVLKTTRKFFLPQFFSYLSHFIDSLLQSHSFQSLIDIGFVCPDEQKRCYIINGGLLRRVLTVCSIERREVRGQKIMKIGSSPVNSFTDSHNNRATDSGQVLKLADQVI
ncbi:MAG: hypothetical protein KKB89_03920, partial [Candidatus Omnitrophica bacterium]|nr:hypothetical protein [Candidatus Omnitrophota bacterium]